MKLRHITELFHAEQLQLLTKVTLSEHFQKANNGCEQCQAVGNLFQLLIHEMKSTSKMHSQWG